MGIDAFGYLLVAIALVLTIVAWNRRNFLLSMVTAGAWLGAWLYISQNLPGGAVIDDNLRTILWVVVIGVMIAVIIRAVPEVRIRKRDDVVPGYDESEHGGIKGFLRRLNGDNVPKNPYRSAQDASNERQRQYREEAHSARIRRTGRTRR